MPRAIELSLSFLVVLTALLLGACGGGGLAGGIPDLLGDGPPSGSDSPSDPPVDPPVDPPAGTSMSAAEFAKGIGILDRVNAVRATHGLAPLVWDDAVAEVAYRHSVDMDERDYFSHTNPDNELPWDRLRAQNVPFNGAGENIYWASWSATAEQAFQAWMDSPGHRNNILGAGWTHTGVGVHDPSAGGSWWTQVFVSR